MFERLPRRAPAPAKSPRGVERAEEPPLAPPGARPHVDLVRTVPARAPRLQVTAPSDAREASADRWAERARPRRVVLGAPPAIKPPRGPTGASAARAAGPTVDAAIAETRGRGGALPDPLRRSLEASLDGDFRGVRVHTGARADSLNRAVGSYAFASGDDIYFKRGAYAPEHSDGQRLIAHELAHTLAPDAPSLIQRTVTLTTGTDTKGTVIITTVDVTRDADEEGLFGASKGDHTTAHVMFRSTIINRLARVPLTAAPAALGHLRDEILALPGNALRATLDTKQQALVTAAETKANAAITAAAAGSTPANCAAAAHALVRLRNLMPLTAAEFGGVGHGEGHANTRLNALEARLRDGGAPLSTAEGRQALTDFTTLLDLGRIRDDFTRVPVTPHLATRYKGYELADTPATKALDQATLPGLTDDPAADLGRILQQHLQTVRSAYPRLWGALHLGPTGARLLHVLHSGLTTDRRDPAVKRPS